MTMFIGMKIDDQSVDAIYDWLTDCYKDSRNSVLAKKFIYIPIAYSQSHLLDEEALRSSLLGAINVPIHLQQMNIEGLGECGNISLMFENSWLDERYKFWKGQDRRFKFKKRYRPRIPMSHTSGYYCQRWLKTFPLTSVTLVEEFATDFDRNAFLKQVKAAQEKYNYNPHKKSFVRPIG